MLLGGIFEKSKQNCTQSKEYFRILQNKLLIQYKCTKVKSRVYTKQQVADSVQQSTWPLSVYKLYMI
jgi:hypothetical protein